MSGTQVVSFSLMAIVPDYFSIEIIIEFLGRGCAAEHRAVARHWTLPPRPTTFVQCSDRWQMNIAAYQIDRLRLDRSRMMHNRSAEEMVDRCELCFLAAVDEEILSDHQVAVINMAACSRASAIPYNDRSVQHIQGLRVLVQLRICFRCSLQFWTLARCGEQVEAPSSSGSTEIDEEEEDEDDAAGDEDLEYPSESQSDTDAYVDFITRCHGG